jgi:primosomal protein N' (replication factor Y)
MVCQIAEVTVNAPVARSFHYLVPDALAGTVGRGHRVLVPFGRRLTTGVCVGFVEKSEFPELKPIQRLLHPDCRFDEHILELTRWVASYYRASWGEVLEAALPPALRRGSEERRSVVVRAARPAAELVAEAERVERRSPALARVLRFLAAQETAVLRREVLEATDARADALRRAVAGGWAREEEVLERPDPYAEEARDLAARVEPELTEAQAAALGAIGEALSAGGFRSFLLHGVTGSGKTEVYLRALRQVLAGGGQGLVLLPEIALTPQTVLRFRQGLPGASVAVLHSMLSAAERTGQWREIQEGKAQLVIGARSAVFAPLAALGLIVVDEEHEPSYKQESSPRYHARDVAVMRARMLGIPVVLGSATPSLESDANASAGKYARLEMLRRATPHDLPVVSLLQLDQDFYRPDGSGLISPQLDELIRRELRAGEQVLIFLNRRGFATFLHCLRCGFVLKCSDCDVAMTYHRREDLARCHYCGVARAAPQRCPDCEMPGPRRSGAGTEKAAEAIAKRYPEARVARLDRDAARTHQALRATVASFGRGEVDILVGTQMVAKGHDFPRVGLVGVLTADTGLHLPDLRSAERTFQLVTQVAGRAGRGKRRGRVIVQTFFPEHYALRFAVAGDYRGFAEKELASRRSLGYPPFGRLVKVLLQGEDEAKVKERAKTTAEALQRGVEAGVQVLGPAASPLARLKGRYRYQALLKSRDSAALRRVLDACEKELRGTKAVDVTVDVDPQSML